MNVRKFDSYKCLPCMVLIQTGYCPYNSQCQFIHPKGFRGSVKSDTKLRNKFDDTKDIFFYPPDRSYKNKDEYCTPNKFKFRRLSVFIHLSKGKSMENYINVDVDVDVDNLKKLKFDTKNSERDIRTLNMLNGLLDFIKFNSKKDNKFLQKNRKKIDNHRKSPTSITFRD